MASINYKRASNTLNGINTSTHLLSLPIIYHFYIWLTSIYNVLFTVASDAIQLSMNNSIRNIQNVFKTYYSEETIMYFVLLGYWS